LADDAAPVRRQQDQRFRAGAVLTLVLLASFLVKLNHLGHPAIKALDESFHALVAKNLLKHPLTPTLIDRPWLPYDYRDWQSNHVWLHKPIVPLWQMALSMAALGTSTLALRLPSAILSTAAAWLTYAIGRELLLDRRAPLIAATLQAFHPAITSMVHGYVFSDHIDVAFLFWTELAMWCLVRTIATGSTRWAIATGVAQGIAFLSKTYPAFIVTGVALVAWQLPLRGWAGMVAPRLRGRHLITILLATFLTAAPWMLSIAIRFPREFAWEQTQIFHHLTRDVEQWAAPWDRLIFDFSLRIYLWFYPAILVATVLLIRVAWRERNLALWLLVAWGLGVLIPHTLATSKTMTATLIGWPPFLLLLGVMITRALDGDAACLGGWFAATVLAAVVPGRIGAQGWGYPDRPGFAVIMRENIWVLWHVLAALAGAVACGIAARFFTPSPGSPGEGWGEGSTATMTCPAPIFASIQLVRMNPTCSPCRFCSASMNATSASVASRTLTSARGIGMIALVMAKTYNGNPSNAANCRPSESLTSLGSFAYDTVLAPPAPAVPCSEIRIRSNPA
jgi:4-amino-4-deoxy-L-arabinose transferase-like glycosyltransferase